MHEIVRFKDIPLYSLFSLYGTEFPGDIELKISKSKFITVKGYKDYSPDYTYWSTSWNAKCIVRYSNEKL